MSHLQPLPPQPLSALVAKATPFRGDNERYLQMTPAGEALWIADPEMATAFASMREAARMAVRLPASIRAFGLLRDVELDARRAH
jgi:hypothetical protein